MKTWLKGGLIAVAIFIPMFFLTSMVGVWEFISPTTLIEEITKPVGLDTLILGNSVGRYAGMIFYIISNSIFYFLIGSIIGLTVKKFKKLDN